LCLANPAAGQKGFWVKHARFRIALSDLIQVQHTGLDRPLAPAAQCGPERRPALAAAEDPSSGRAVGGKQPVGLVERLFSPGRDDIG